MKKILKKALVKGTASLLCVQAIMKRLRENRLAAAYQMSKKLMKPHMCEAHVISLFNVFFAAM